MLTVEQGLSEYMMYPLLLEDGSFKYFTKDGVIAYKERLDKKLKNYNLFNIIRWVIFSICIMYCLSITILSQFLCNTVFDYLKISTIFIIPISINLATWQIIDRHQMFLFRKFLDVYGRYFSFNRYWKKISQNNSKRLRCQIT
jgi:hypothetical protein